ncbi:MAG: zinc ribbon domain-containing protein [Chloroflexi bacterium]|nr:zinc ribbon domain-containing protein [Chloroflexota bacterium]
MTNEILTEIACPNCLNPIDVREHGRHVTCDACNSKFILEGHICPQCQTYHRQDQPFCRECGEPMTRTCQKCQTINWSGDEYCRQCGAAMDIFQLLNQTHSHATADRLNEQMAWSRDIKEQERIASDNRMAQMMADEKVRLQENARRRAVQREKDRQLFLLIGVFTLVVIAIILAVSLL